MSGPWENYQAAPAAEAVGPWMRYAAPEGGLVINMTNRSGDGPTAGGVQDWEPEAYSGGQKVARSVGLAAQGVNDAFLPTLIGAPVDAAAWGLRQIGIPVNRPPGGSESIKSGIDYVATLPGRVGDAVSQGSLNPLTDSRTSRIEPLNQTERTAYGAGEGVGNVLAIMAPASAVAQTAKAGSVTAGAANALATQPVLQTAAGGIAGGVTGATDNPWLGLAAGVGVPLTAAAVSKGAKVAGSLVQPMTGGGRDQIVGRTLNTLADDSTRAVENMKNYKPPVEGFKLSAAKASGDDSLMASENALARAGAGFGERTNANNAALADALAKLDRGGDPKAFVAALNNLDTAAAARAQAALDALPPNVDAATAGLAIQSALRGRFDALTTARSEAAAPYYRAARASQKPVPALPLASYVDDQITANKGEPRALMERVRGLLFDQDGQLDRSANGMMASRAAINDMLDNQQIGNHSKSLLLGVRSKLDEALAAIPAERKAREVFAKGSVPLEPFDAKLGNKNVASTIAKDRFGKDFLMEPDLVPGRFLRPGDTGGATMRELLEAKPGEQAKNALGGVIAGKVREGNPLAVAKQYGPAIGTMSPRLAGQIDDAAATNVLASGFRASPAGRFLTDDLDAAVRSTLGAPDSANRLKSLAVSIGDDPKAIAGMQKAIIDDFRRAAFSTVAEDAAGNAKLLASGAERWLQANREALGGILTEAQAAGLDAISRALKDQSRNAVKVAGSDTARNLATQNIIESLLWKGAGDSAVLAPLRKTLGLVYGGANEKTAERLAEVMLDPKVAAALMEKASLKSVTKAISTLDRISLATAAGSNVETRPNPLGGK